MVDFTKVKTWARHGDVCIYKVDELPEGAEALNHRVLREGEATGHKHEMMSPTTQLFKSNGLLYMNVPNPEGDTITHQQHGPQHIPQGVWVVEGTLEYNHLDEESRVVAD